MFKIIKYLQNKVYNLQRYSEKSYLPTNFMEDIINNMIYNKYINIFECIYYLFLINLYYKIYMKHFFYELQGNDNFNNGKP